MFAKIGFYISVFNTFSSFAFAFCGVFSDPLLLVAAAVALQHLAMPPRLWEALVVAGDVYVVLGGRVAQSDAAVHGDVLPLLDEGID